MKRNIIITLLLCAVSINGLILPAYANSIDDVLTIKQSILNSKGGSTLDINGDNRVDVLDLISLKQEVIDNASLKDYSATKEYVKLISRYSIKDDTTWLNQSGSAIEFNFTGTKLNLNILGDTSCGTQNPPRYAILFNDTVLVDKLITSKTEEVSIIDSDSTVSGVVKVIKLTEANCGSIGIKDISVTSDSTTPITPTDKKDLTIEFVGDSITCAYGVEAKDQTETFSSSTENFMKSYAYLTAQRLNADYSTLCYSGNGVYSGFTSDGVINLRDTIPAKYEGVSTQWEYKDLSWNFENNPVDVVLLNLGTNDYSYLKYDLSGRSDDYILSYIEFLKLIRKYNPNAKIVCTMGLMGGQEVFAYIQEAIAEYSSQTNDYEVYSFMLSAQSLDNGIGADWHPSAKSQRLCSDEVVENIQKILNS